VLEEKTKEYSTRMQLQHLAGCAGVVKEGCLSIGPEGSACVTVNDGDNFLEMPIFLEQTYYAIP
jgi:hypothetical protein